MYTFLKFSYFLAFFLILSCGEKTNKLLQDKTDQSASESTPLVENTSKTILFFGNSLTAGIGLDPEEAFPALIQKKLDSLGLEYEVINAGLSGETTASGKNRLDWVLNQKVDVFILELGANDGLRGIPLKETRNNLQAIISAVRKKNSNTKIILAGMQIPPNLGKAYTTEFKEIFPSLADKNSALLIPFLLEDVAGIPTLNQDDGIHPTKEGQIIVANNVWKILETVIVQ